MAVGAGATGGYLKTFVVPNLDTSQIFLEHLQYTRRCLALEFQE